MHELALYHYLIIKEKALAYDEFGDEAINECEALLKKKLIRKEKEYIPCFIRLLKADLEVKEDLNYPEL